MANISGVWLGTYWQQEDPVRFELSVVQGGNSISGNILDDNYLGEASITGEVTGRRISFTKKYLGSPRAAVFYLGLIAEDENFMQGQWSINEVSGLWEAHRQEDNLVFDLEQKKAEPLGIR